MLDCFLVASCTCIDLYLCKSSSISFPTSWKGHNFCKVFNGAHREKLNSVQKFVKIKSWLFLLFSTYFTHNHIINILLYCRLPGWLYSPVGMRNSSKRTSHKFRRLPLCSVLYFDLMEFSENGDKEFQLGPMLFQTR